MEKYLNKEVKVLIKILGTGITEKEEGILTSATDRFIELDNEKIINTSFIMEIILK